ncbi:MAG: glucose-1-phosphate thymidylyltransferase [Muribaculaceae bacterium]|nr:glucose-1-phosphate thymidylyltransferase [Muribaculaceae bacterium]
MKNIILFDDSIVRENLLPLSFTRPVADFRIGITTIREKWQRHIPGRYSYMTVDYLSGKYPLITDEDGDNIFIAGNVCPSPLLVEAVLAMPLSGAVLGDKGLLAFRGTVEDFNARMWNEEIRISSSPVSVNMLYDLFVNNGQVLVDDYRGIVAGRKSLTLSPTNTVVGEMFYPDGTPKIFIEEGATVEAAVLNVKNGPIYIGRNAEIMEGSCVRGPFALCEHGVVNMGTRIYGATTLGPCCKVGGELNNVVMMGYSNKAHDGFLGNAVIGEWCNLGGGTVASNLKNDYTEIKLWNYRAHRFLRTGLQFCGLIMGDHSKSGINCMFNTATVLGVGVNIHGAGFPRNFVASFSEGSSAGFSDVPLAKFFDIARRVMARRNVSLTDEDIRIFESVYAIADNYK